MYIMKKSLGIAAVLLSSQSFAGDFDFGIYLAQEYAKKDVALEQGFDEAMQSGGFTLSYSSSKENSLRLENNPYDDFQDSNGGYSILVGYGYISAADNDNFTVSTVDSNDDHGSRSSSVGGDTFFGELGYNYFVNKKLDLFFNLGRANFDLKRSISACTNCPEESLTVNTSNYAHIGASYGSHPKIKVGYQHHIAGDMINSLRLQLAW